jgi:hypothetical protein
MLAGISKEIVQVIKSRETQIMNQEIALKKEAGRIEAVSMP